GGEPGLDGRLGLQCGAELGLAAGAAGEHDEPPGHLVGHLGPVVLLDEGEGEVDACGDTSARPAVPVPDVDAVVLDVDRGVLPGERRARGPVGGGTSTVEETGGGKDEGPGADRGDAARPAGDGGDVRDEGLVAGSLPGTEAAGDEQGVDR